MTVSTSQRAYFTFPIDMAPPAVTRRDTLVTTQLPSITLYNAELHAITEQECVDIVMKELDLGRAGSVLTMNLDHLRRYNQDALCRELYARATIHVADGMPLVWASRLQGTPLPERVTGSNMIWSLSKAAAAHQRSVFFLGGEPGTAEEAADVLCENYPDLKVAGCFCPSMGFESREEEMASIAQALIDAQPDIVYVALGTPKQDRLIESLRDYLPTVWWIGVGISFSFVTGEVSRAPRWMQDSGFEWLHRMFQEPGRLIQRYLMNGVPFALQLMATSLLKRILRS